LVEAQVGGRAGKASLKRRVFQADHQARIGREKGARGEQCFRDHSVSTVNDFSLSRGGKKKRAL